MRVLHSSKFFALLALVGPTLASTSVGATEKYSRTYEERQVLRGDKQDGLVAARNQCNQMIERQDRHVFGLLGDSTDLKRQGEDFPWGISKYSPKQLQMTLGCSQIRVSANYTARIGKRQLHETSPMSSAIIGALTLGASLVHEARATREGEVLAISRLDVRCTSARAEADRDFLEKFLACEKQARNEVRWYRSVREVYLQGKLQNLSAECENLFRSAQTKTISATEFDLAPENSCEQLMEAMESPASCR
jgi:hypothetical protein